MHSTVLKSSVCGAGHIVPAQWESRCCVCRLEEGGVLTDCSLKTQEPDEILDFNFNSANVVNKIIMKVGCTYHQSLLWFTASFDLTVLYSHWCSACKREINSIVYSLELQVCYTNPTNCYSTKPKFWSSLNYCIEFGPGHWWRSSFSPVPMEIFPRGAIIPL